MVRGSVLQVENDAVVRFEEMEGSFAIETKFGSVPQVEYTDCGAWLECELQSIRR